jgi:hypothetical protein
MSMATDVLLALATLGGTTDRMISIYVTSPREAKASKVVIVAVIFTVKNFANINTAIFSLEFLLGLPFQSCPLYCLFYY